MPLPSQATIDGDAYLIAFSKWLRAHERRLGQATAANLLPGRRVVSQSWLAPTAKDIKPLTLQIDPHHLCYLLLRFEEAGLAANHTGPLDLPLDTPLTRPLSFIGLLQNGGDLSAISSRKDNSDTSSIMSAVSTTFSFGSSWLSSNQQSKSKDVLLGDARFAYACFTKLPSLSLSPSLPPPPLNAFVRGFETIPDGVYVPLYAFKNLQFLTLDSLDPLAILGWDFLADSLKTLEIRKSGIEDVSQLFVDAVVDDARRRDGKRVDNRLRDGEEQVKMLPPTKWRFLRRLVLAQNDITLISSCPWNHFDALVHLDLSSNLLVSIPAGLSSLISLRSLNLANNMIDSILSISAQLGAIVSLNLSRNRLTSLCGLERLLNLRSIDVTNNLLEDSGEVGRLSSLPYIQEVWSAEGNVFNQREKLFDWRVALFTAFHAHNNADVKLDGSVPSWQEARWIGAPETKSRLLAAKEEQKAKEAALQAKKVSARQRNVSTASTVVKDVERSPSPENPRPKSPPSVSKATKVAHKPKKRKPRRIVNLDGTTTLVSPPPTTVASFVTAAEDISDSSALPSPSLTSAAPTPSLEVEENEPRAHQRYPSAPHTVSHKIARPRITHASPSTTGRSSTLGRLSRERASRPTVNQGFFDPPTSETEGEAFRKRIEALRNEVGENWLNVLNATENSNRQSKPPPS